MVLVDTSVWVSHLREGSKELGRLLNDGDVMLHPFIIGELACGNIKNRHKVLSLLQLLPMVIQVEHEEVLQFIEKNKCPHITRDTVIEALVKEREKHPTWGPKKAPGDSCPFLS